MYFSWSWFQPEGTVKISYHAGEKKPYVSFSTFHSRGKVAMSLPLKLKRKLANILLHRQEGLENLFKDIEVMQDDLRTMLFGCPLGKSF